MNSSKNDDAWEIIFERNSILEEIERQGSVSISSTEINRVREARLMTKFDHRSQLPKLFQENKLSILPTSRGMYEIGTYETFLDFSDEDVEITPISFPTYLESLDYKDITSEATAINCAFVSGILQDFSDEERLIPTVSGRMSSSLFNFRINSNSGMRVITVGNSQLEIDGGYEGSSSLSLIEAKNYISSDFLIRQLYYPYRLWSSKIAKRVCPIFLTYSNGIFHLREYKFKEMDYYNSICLVKHKKYIIKDGSINIESIQVILDNVDVIQEPKLPFPQADSFERIINLCELLKQKGFLSKEDITQNYDFDHRQTDYYTNAGKYLGLIESCSENSQRGCSLSANGLRIFSQSIFERQLEFVRLILSHKAFRDSLRLYFNNGMIPSKEEIVKIMHESNIYNIDSEHTYTRRASTVISWINWILDLVEE